MKRIYLLTAALLMVTTAWAQQSVSLRINHMMGAAPFVLSTGIGTNDLGQSFKVSRLQYYIAEIELIHDGGTYTMVPDTWILANAGQLLLKPLGSFGITSLEGIRFGIGVQQSYNHLDPATYPSSHPLAPQSPSMHWGWSSGYRFVAMEGTAGSGFMQNYELHGLDDANYFKVTVMTSGVVSGQDLIVDLNANYAEAAHGIDLASGPISHGATGAALTCLQNFSSRVFTAALSTQVQDPQSVSPFTLGPNPSAGLIHTRLAVSDPASYTLHVMDMAGREVLVQPVGASGATDLQLTDAGCYMVVLKNKHLFVAAHKVVIAH